MADRAASMRTRSRWITLAAVVVLAVLVLLVALAVAGTDLFGPRRDAVSMLLLAALAAGALAIVVWWQERKASEALSREAAEAQRLLESRRADIERLESEGAELRAELEAAKRAHGSFVSRMESQLRELQETLNRERSLRSQVETARDADRKWARELRTHFAQITHQQPSLARTDEVPALVLRASVAMLGAAKGMLLSREDADHDGKLDVAASEGFEHDPERSAIAQHFAELVLERDETVRITDPTELRRQRSTPADEEIDNLVAIPIFIQDHFSGVVVCANNPDGFEHADDEVLLAVGDHAGAVLQNARLQGELRSSYLATVRMLAEAVEMRDLDLRGHLEQVATWMTAAADRLGFDAARREQLMLASLLHDVGKIGISERILLKPATLSPEERSVVELHPRIGYRLVQQIPTLGEVASAILHHHERFDGTGYPARLKGTEIPFEARMMAVVDSFSAMTTDRPYREARSFDDACAELERCAGTQFDPDIVRAFLDEVAGAQPPDGHDGALAAALSDPEVELRRHDDEPVLGHDVLAITDNLTLLYGHSYFFRLVEAEARRARASGWPFAVVVVSLVDLAELNRAHGYAAGDAAIRTAAVALQRVAASYAGATACRLSGRSLAVVLPGAEQAEAAVVAAEIRSYLSLGPEAGVGTAVWESADTPETLVERARAAAALPPAAASSPAAPFEPGYDRSDG